MRTFTENEKISMDLISRQAAITTSLEFIVEYLGGAFDEDFQKELKKRLEALPPTEPEQEKGKWIWQIENRYVCSECGHHTQVDELFEEPMYAFCPYCSTSMLDEDGNVRYER